MKKGAGVGIVGGEKESEQGLHQALSGRLAIPKQTILRPVLSSSRHSQFIQIATIKTV